MITEDDAPSVRVVVVAVRGESATAQADEVAGEAALAIEVEARWFTEDPQAAKWATQTVAVTLRTPPSPRTDGCEEDLELATGYVLSEGLLDEARHLEARQTISADRVRLRIGGSEPLAWQTLDRQGLVHSGCGLCGKRGVFSPRPWQAPSAVQSPLLEPAVVSRLGVTLRQAQSVFARTGGLHAAGLFSPDGTLWVVREDIGRHNAVDKVIGHALLQAPTWLSQGVLLLSGRAGFELVHKAKMAGIAVVVSVGAPSSMAVAAAHQAGITLVGFCREDRFNVYSVPSRIRTVPTTDSR